MQPARTEHVRFLQTALAVLLLSLGAGGCETGGAPDPARTFAPTDTLVVAQPAERDSALALLRRMDRMAFDSAFARLDRYAFLREVRTEQLRSDGSVDAWRTQRLRYADGPTQVVARDSSGAFGGGGLGPFAPSATPERRPANLATQAFPDDPAYLSARTRAAFQYAFGPDTTISGTDARVVEIQARRRTSETSSGEGADQAVRYARLAIARGSNQLLAAHTVRAERALLFREDSELTVGLRRAPDGTWVPHVTAFRARVDVPLRDPQYVRTRSTYDGYARL